MKRNRFCALALLLFLLSAFCSLFCAAHSAAAQSTVFGGGITFTNTSTNSIVIQTNTVSANVGRFYITLPNGIGAGTNFFSGYREYSLDGTNFFPVGATFIPTSTNAASYTVDPATLSFPLYLRMRASSATNATVSALYVSPN